MKKALVTFLVLPIIIFLFTGQVNAHPGNTDSSGGHTCRTNCPRWGLDYGDYHYHGGYSRSTPTPVRTWSYKGTTYYSFKAANDAFWTDYYREIDQIYLRLLERSSTERERKYWSRGVTFSTGYNTTKIVNFIRSSEEYKKRQIPTSTPTIQTEVLGTTDQKSNDWWMIWLVIFGVVGIAWVSNKLSKDK